MNQQAGQYYLIEKIAQGGMAEIYRGLAYDANGLKRTVCIKKILPHIAASPEFIDTLVNEAKIAVKLSHGNIAQTYDLGKVGNDYFMVMEYVHGKSLSQLCKRAKQLGETVPLPLLAYIAAEAANGLDYMHRRTDDAGQALNIIHRDVSPQNILVSYSGTIKLIDFGIALAANRLGFTEAGILKGKFSFMSPEQARGEALDHRSDIFSLGVVLHEAITDQRLFKADDNRETIRNVRKAHVDPPSTIKAGIPEEFDRICLRALAKDRRRRYTTAAEMRDALTKLLYAVYPSFQAADLARYMQKLFPEEMAEPALEKEPTPQLIIEGTQSALAENHAQESEHTSIAPQALNLSEYFLDDEKSAVTPAEETSVSASVSVSESFSDEITSHVKNFGTKKWFAIGTLAIALASLSWWLNSTSEPELELPALPPINVPTLPPQAIAPKIVEPKKPLPQIGNISVSSNPQGARIFLDDQETKLRTPATLTNIKTGKHSVGLFLPNYRFARKELTLDDISAAVEMNLEKDFGSLFISSQPAKALVVLNGKPLGETPIRFEKMEPSQVYHIEVWSEGYERQVRDVQAIAGREQQLNLILERAKKP